MDSQILMRLNEIYRHNVYNEEVLSEETLSEEELVDINGWVSSLISEGYDLDDYSDEELYAAYLSALDEAKKYESQVLLKGVPSELHKMVKQASRSQRNKSTPTTFRQRIIRDKTSKYRQDDSMPEPRASARGPESPTHLEELDLYDIVSEYLVSEGFCDSYEDADVIMANMSEEWRGSIVNTLIEEGFVSPYKAPHAHGRSMDNPGRLSPAMKAMDKSDKLQKTEPGSERQKMQTRRSNQLNKMFSAARRA